MLETKTFVYVFKDALPFQSHSSVQLGLKFAPLTVISNVGLPAWTDGGFRDVITGGPGLPPLDDEALEPPQHARSAMAEKPKHRHHFGDEAGQAHNYSWDTMGRLHSWLVYSCQVKIWRT